MSLEETTESTAPPKKTLPEKTASFIGVLSGFRLISQTKTNVEGVKSTYGDLFKFSFIKPVITRKPYEPATPAEYRARYINIQRTACVMLAISTYCAFGLVMDYSHLTKIASYSIMGGVSLSLYLGYTRLMYRVRLQYANKKSVLVTWADYFIAVKGSPLNLLPISIPKNNKKEGVL